MPSETMNQSPMLGWCREECVRHSNKLRQRGCELIVAISILIAGLGAAHATDLSGGIKGLKLGMPKAQVLAMLDSMATDAGGLFAPACEPDTDGEQCVAIGIKLSYAKAQIAFLSVHFSTRGLDHVSFSLSMAGCGTNNLTEQHPAQQFKSISDSLVQHIGPPTGMTNHRIVWTDSRAALILNLDEPDSSHLMYPTCPRTTVVYVEYSRGLKLLNRNRVEKAKELDL